MKRLTTLALIFWSSLSFAAAVWVSGSDVKTLKPNIDLNGQAKILSGTVDPTTTATSAPIGSIYLNSSTGVAYRKLDSGSSTNWTNMAVGTLQTPVLLGTVKVTGCSSSWSTSSTTFASFAAQTGCAYTATGSLAAPSTNIPGFQIASLPAGTLVIQSEGGFYNNAATAAAYYQFSDGTNTANEVSVVNTTASSAAVPSISQSIAYSTSQTSLTVSLRGKTDSGGSANITNSAAQPASFKVWLWPAAAQTIVQPSPQSLDVLGQMNYVLGSTCPSGSVAADGSSLSTTTYAALFNRIGYTYGGSGATFKVPDLRGLFVRGAGTNGTYTNANGSAYSATLATEQNDQMQGHVHTMITTLAQAVGSFYQNINSGSMTLASQQQTSNPAADGTNGTPRTGVETRPANIALTPCISNATMPMPVIPSSVITSSAGVERLERAKVGSTCTTSTCSVTSQSGGFGTTVTRSSTGVYAGTFATVYSSAPSCTCAAGGGPTSCTITNLTTTAFSVFTFSGSTATDGSLDILCQGPK